MAIVEDNLYCPGDHSCEKATILSTRYNYIYGHAAAKVGTFYSQDGSLDYVFYGQSGGDGATIWCDNGYNCNTDCYQDACNNLELKCVDGDGTCTFSIDCSYARKQKSDIYLGSEI